MICALTSFDAATKPAPEMKTSLHVLPPDPAEVPADAVAASFGCGNPTTLAELAAGEIVLDLGSGGGIDVLLDERVPPGEEARGRLSRSSK